MRDAEADKPGSDNYDPNEIGGASPNLSCLMMTELLPCRQSHAARNFQLNFPF